MQAPDARASARFPIRDHNEPHSVLLTPETGWIDRRRTVFDGALLG
jgi:hypothetical protein